jgi:hypothetical protein
MYRDIRLNYGAEPVSADELFGDEMFEETKSIETSS